MSSSTSNSDVKRLLKKLAIIVTGFLFLFVVTSYLYRTNVNTPLSMFIEKIEDFKDSDKKVKVLIIGNSLPGMGLKHRYLPDYFYNLGFTNHNFTDQFLLLKWAYRQHPEVEYLVIQSDLHVFSPYTRKYSHPKRSLHFATFRQVIDTYNLSYLEFIKQTSYYYLPLLDPRRRFSLPKFFNHYFQSLPYGNQKLDQERYFLDKNKDLNFLKNIRWDQLSRKTRTLLVKKRIRKKFGTEGKIFDPEMIQTFKKLKKFAIRKDMKLIYLRFPLTNLHIQKLPGTSKDEKRFRKILRTKHAAMKLDLRDVFRDRQGYFRDTDHLNYKGAVAFTKIFLDAFRNRIGSPVKHKLNHTTQDS